MSVRPSGDQFEIRHGAARAIIVEVGGGIRAFQIGDEHILDGFGEDEMCSGGRGQVLIPWPNRIRDGEYTFQGEGFQLALSEPAHHNAIHGLVRWHNWIADDHGDGEVTMRHRLYPSPGYPFCLDLAVRYAVSDREMRVTTSATNIGTRPCPFGAGWHPYLRIGSDSVDSALLRVPADGYLRLDGQKIPIAREPVAGTEFDFRIARAVGPAVLDVAYTDLEHDAEGHACVELRSSNASQRLELWMDGAYRYAMIFTGDTLHPVSRRRRGIAIEPMTCAPNAFVSGDGLMVIEPNETVSMTWGVRARPEETHVPSAAPSGDPEVQA